MINKNNKRISVKFTTEQYEILEGIAKKGNISLSTLISSIVIGCVGEFIKEVE